MDARIPRACGTWSSPVSASLCAGSVDSGGASAMFEAQSDGASLFWLSALPREGGRSALRQWCRNGDIRSMLDAPWDLRSGVNEYGGGAYAVANGMTWFSHFADSRIYAARYNAEPIALTEPGPYRYGDLVLDGRRSRLICVRESFLGIGDYRREEATELVAIDLETGIVRVLVTGADFVAAPRLSQDGDELAWLSWNHPAMPWDDAALHRATVDAKGDLGDAQFEASCGSQGRMQPRWGLNGDLYYVSDLDGWWNLYRWSKGEQTGRQVTRLQAEIGGPMWRLGERHWDFVDARRAAVVFHRDGRWHAATIDLGSGFVLDCSPAHALITSLTVLGEKVFLVGADEVGGAGLYEYDAGAIRLHIAVSSAESLPQGLAISVAQQVSVPLAGSGCAVEGERCHAWFYPPASTAFEPPPGEAPPVIVQFHGGPTSASSSAFSLSRQFWTSRGFAVLDVNYRGSTGRGREYRRRLHLNYGVVDVEDAEASLRYATGVGLVDGLRAVISGASSGGYTALAALTHCDSFAAGINLFGVSDLFAFQRSAHKFESRYLEFLVGDWVKDRERIVNRSPINRLNAISAPLLTLQGSDDRIVPREQSLLVMKAVRERGLPCCYIEFEGEGHGFRRHHSLERTLEASLSFLGQILGFQPDDDIEPVIIVNKPHPVPPLLQFRP